MPSTAALKLKSELPLIPLKDLVLFPRLSVPLTIGEEKSLLALNDAMQTDQVCIFSALKPSEGGAVSPEQIYRVGTAAKIIEASKQPDGTARILVQGMARVKISAFVSSNPYFKVAAEILPDFFPVKNEKIEALMYSALNQFKECVNLGATVPFDILLVILNMANPLELADLIAVNIDFSLAERQSLLEAENAEERLDRVNQALGRQIKVLRMARKIQTETGKELGKMEREMMLREQLKAIEKELGVVGGRSDIEDVRKKIDESGMSEETKEIAKKELARLEGMPSFSPEISYIRTYLDWLIGLPWAKRDEKAINVKEAGKILDEDHYGLEKVKERVTEYLAVQKLVGKIKGPILCFVGPPGTGKTSIGKSIARALGRKFFRMSLGGIRDEAEIRGHRRTYVGALPGRIIQGIKTAGTKNPVFMLYEIDKVGADFRGDPTSALLEALDPEQNNSFSDHYLEVPFDLSDVMFITTANLLDPIQPALKDRMEVIDFPGYTEEEKFNIATKFLIPKQLKDNGLSGGGTVITEPALREIIRAYTLEAGVRNLEREISKIFRKIAKEVSTDGKKNYKVGLDDLKKYLGVPRFRHLAAEKADEVGVVTGLAWTEAGGDILLIEATRMPGKGNLILTGQLGKVMQESAQAAFSYARAKISFWKIKDKFWSEEDIHVHVPAGAIPKDGPSAGVAMGVVLVSLLTGKKIRIKVGMTGEITLRGRVLEIGGVKEKVLAAHRAGLKTIILPKDNEKDLEDVPDEVRKTMEFKFVTEMDEVLKLALV